MRIAGGLILHRLSRTQIMLLGGGSNARCMRGTVVAWDVRYFFRMMARWTMGLGINKAKRGLQLRWL